MANARAATSPMAPLMPMMQSTLARNASAWTFEPSRVRKPMENTVYGFIATAARDRARRSRVPDNEPSARQRCPCVAVVAWFAIFHVVRHRLRRFDRRQRAVGDGVLGGTE